MHAAKIGRDRRHELDQDGQTIERLFVDLFLEAHREPPMRIVVDLDATDDPLYRDQEGQHFHGYYDCYCYLPLYVFRGCHLLAAKLRSSACDAAEGGAAREVARIVGHIRERPHKTTIVVRADSRFCRDDLLARCEENGLQAGNKRLEVQVAPDMQAAARKAKRTGKPAREFADFRYRKCKSWSAERRVIGKAEFTNGRANPRFIVTNVHAAFGSPRLFYETIYCQRGEMENRLKECQGDLLSDRTPTPTSCRRPVARPVSACHRHRRATPRHHSM